MPTTGSLISHSVTISKNSSLFSLKNKGICKTKEKVRTYCTSGKTESIKLNPWFVTGLSDEDGSFYIVLRKDSTCRFGFSISLEYKVVAGVNPLNLKLLELVQSFFQKHSIYGAKQSDFLDFSLGMDIINKKGHLTPEGLNELNKIAYGMNSYRKF